MESVALVTALALVQFFYFGYAVSMARMRHGIEAPATTGHPDFDRNFRIHQNTLEQLIVFLPALWIFGWYVHGLIAALLGLVFIAGRHLYRARYLEDPEKRALGVMIGGEIGRAHV